MPTTVPCASGVAANCRQHIPLGAVPWRDPVDAAAVCDACGEALAFEKRLSRDDRETSQIRDPNPLARPSVPNPHAR